MTSTFGGCCDHRATPESHPGSCPRFSLVKGMMFRAGFLKLSGTLTAILLSRVLLFFQSVMRTCNSTVARQNNNSDSDFIPGSNQIQDLRTPKYINIIYQVMGTRICEFCLAEQKLGVRIAVVPESVTSTVELVELNRLPNLISKFDWGAVLLPFLCRT